MKRATPMLLANPPKQMREMMLVTLASQTGIEASDHSETIRAATDSRRLPEDFAWPGHFFALRPQLMARL